MNFLKKFIGAAPTDEVALIPSGKLFLTRSPHLPKGALECLYNDALISINQTTTPYYYQLAVTKAYQEGELNLESTGDEDDDDDTEGNPEDISNKDERVFYLTPELKARLYTKNDGTRVIVWKDWNGDIGDRFEFTVDEDVKYNEVDNFMMSLYRCLYEQKYQKSSVGVTSMAQLSEFIYDPKRDSEGEDSSIDKLRELQALRSHFAESEDDLDDEEDDGEEDEEDEDYDDEEVFKDALELPLHVFKDTLKVEGRHAYTGTVDIRFFDLDSDSFRLVKLGLVVSIVETGKLQWSLVSEESKYSFSVPLTQEMNPSFNNELNVFIFNHYTIDVTGEGTAYSFLFQFGSSELLAKFREAFYVAIYETVTLRERATDQVEQAYIEDAFGRLVVTDSDESADFHSADEVEEDEEEDEERVAKIIQSSVRTKESRLFVSSDSEDEYGDEDKNKQQTHFLNSNYKNSGLSVGLASDRSYISRGDRLGVYTERENDMKYVTTIGDIKDLNGKQFIPNKMMLHQKDNIMVMSSKDASDSKLYKMDLSRGRIVEQWDADDAEKLTDFAPVNKLAPLTNEQTLTGVSANSLFRIDPRLSGKKVVKDKTFKGYKTKKNGFDTMAVTESGYIAVGLNDGGIRLYDKLGLNAKTALPSLGEGFLGLDVSKDGRWLLATCKTYLLLIDLKIGKDQKNAGSVGFEKYFDADKKPVPKRLALKPEHVSFISQTTKARSAEFTRAVFNTLLTSKETTIVTSTGPYVISWSLNDLVRNRNPQLVYKMHRYQQDVVADSFLFNSHNEVITALQDDIALAHQAAFKRANKSTIVKEY